LNVRKENSIKKIVFFTEPEWAFGIIHYELIKYLFQYRINATVLNWFTSYTTAEIQELSRSIDYFVSTPHGIGILIDQHGIQPEKCVVVAHAALDLQHFSWFTADNQARVHNYGVVSDWLAKQSRALGISRPPAVALIGINYHAFYTKPGLELRTVGYAGAINPDNIHRHIKRPWLVEQATAQAGLEFRAAHAYHHSWVTMPGFYQAVDAVVVASTEEGAGLPALEASAAGRLVISTPVGIWLAKAGTSGHTVPIEESRFVSETVSLLNFYRDDPTAYRLKCESTQAHAECYDWSRVIGTWVELLE
jgi:glycosyltransferase involved in cell wall biosynthesis